MTTLLSYLRLLLFLAGVLAGVQLPMFVDQYGKALTAHFAESERSIREYEDEAKMHFGGSFEQLIAHYKASGDPVFQDGGNSIQAIYSRYLALKEALFDFKKSSWSAYKQAFLKPIPDIQAEVRQNYTYSVRLDSHAIVCGLSAGLVLALLGETLLRVFVTLLAPRRKSRISAKRP